MITDIKKFKSLETGRHWFEKHSKADYTKYVRIEANIFWSYYTAAKYRHLVDYGSTKEAKDFIDSYRVEVAKKINSAQKCIKEWTNIPSDMRLLLNGAYNETSAFISSSIEMSDKICFHKKYKVAIEEPLDDIVNSIERGQSYKRMCSQITDEFYINSLYNKWLYIYDEAITHLFMVTDITSWESFRGYCLRNIHGSLPTQKQIEASALAVIRHLEIREDMINEVAQKYTNLWLQMFNSSFQFNRFFLFWANKKDLPSEECLDQCESLMFKATKNLFNSCIPLVNLLLCDDIYSS